MEAKKTNRRLNPEPRRCDLSVRECTSILGGSIGGLCQNANVETVRQAVQWWAETDEAWAMFYRLADGAPDLLSKLRSPKS